MISRDDALELLKTEIKEDNLLYHSIEAEAVMRGLAQKLGEDVELWGITGLLHDLDYSATRDEPGRHGLVSSEMLEGKLPDEALHAIRAHNFEMTGVEPDTIFDYALRCGETVTGLVHSNALVRPGGMDGMKPKSLKKKMKEKAFAANVNRDTIRECDKIGIELGEFFQIAIDSIEGVSSEAGLS